MRDTQVQTRVRKEGRARREKGDRKEEQGGRRREDKKCNQWRLLSFHEKRRGV